MLRWVWWALRGCFVLSDEKYKKWISEAPFPRVDGEKDVRAVEGDKAYALASVSSSPAREPESVRPGMPTWEDYRRIPHRFESLKNTFQCALCGWWDRDEIHALDRKIAAYVEQTRAEQAAHHAEADKKEPRHRFRPKVLGPEGLCGLCDERQDNPVHLGPLEVE